jgi:plasmid replication initiation protein
MRKETKSIENLIENSFVDLKVYKNNEIISAKSDAMSALESKLLLTALAKCDASPDSIDTVTFNVEEYCEIAGTKKDGSYTDIAKACEGLIKKGVYLKIDKDIGKCYSWVSDTGYNKGTISITINPTIKPYVAFAKGVPYTKYYLSNILRMDSKHAIRLYEILKQVQRKKSRTITLKELRDMMGLKSKTYKMAYKLKEKVLNVALKEINELSDISVTYEEIRTGRLLTGLKFNVEPKIDLSEFEKMNKEGLVNLISNKIKDQYGFVINTKILSEQHRIVLIDLLQAIEHGFTCEIKTEGFFYNLLKIIKEKYDLENLKDY